MSGGMADGMSENMWDKMSGWMSDGMSENMWEKMSWNVRKCEKMPDHMSENIWEKMSDIQNVRKYVR